MNVRPRSQGKTHVYIYLSSYALCCYKARSTVKTTPYASRLGIRKAQHASPTPSTGPPRWRQLRYGDRLHDWSQASRHRLLVVWSRVRVPWAAV